MTSGGATSRARRLSAKATPLSLMILALLSERPMHPYEMQRVVNYRGKDEIVRVQRGSLYPAVERLVTAGLVEPVETVREGRRPERTTYRLTEDGEEACRTWLAEMLRTPAREYPEFPVALAFLPVLTSDEARAQLGGRIVMLRREIAALETSLQMLDSEFSMPRLFVIEDQFRLHMKRAELDWVTAVVADLDSGSLHWDTETIIAWVKQTEARVGPMPGTGSTSRPRPADTD